MNYPAASCGVSEKPKLLPMYLLIPRTLTSDVLLDARFVALLPYGTHKIPVAPKLSSPQLLLYLWTGCQYLPCRDALDDLYDSLRTIHWHRLHQKVHMVLVCTNFDECHLISFADFHTCLFELFVHWRREHHSPILCRTHNVVQKNRYLMTLMDIAAHASHYIAASCGELTRSD